MALLTDAERREAWAELMQELSANPDSSPAQVLKPDLRAAIDATDTWIDGNTASFNSALPLPFRTAANVRQKVRLFVFVLRKRFEVS